MGICIASDQFAEALLSFFRHSTSTDSEGEISILVKLESLLYDLVNPANQLEVGYITAVSQVQDEVSQVECL